MLPNSISLDDSINSIGTYKTFSTYFMAYVSKSLAKVISDIWYPHKLYSPTNFSALKYFYITSKFRISLIREKKSALNYVRIWYSEKRKNIELNSYFNCIIIKRRDIPGEMLTRGKCDLKTLHSNAPLLLFFLYQVTIGLPFLGGWWGYFKNKTIR